MNIVYAGTLPPHPGGSAMLGADLLAGLARRGHQITAIGPITDAALAQDDPLAGAAFGVARYRVASFETSPNHPASGEFRAAERQSVDRLLAPLLEAGRVDLVIAGRETFATHVPALARRYGVRNVVLAQGGTTWGLLSGAFPPELARALRAGLAVADCVIAVAHHLAERLRELGLQRIEVVPNAVDTHAFTPGPRDATLLRELELPEASVIVAHVSNLKDIKRPLDLVHAAAAALPRDPRLWFVIVGDGPCRALVETECVRLGVRARFRFSEWVPRTAVPRYLRLADVVVMPSEAEALALVYLETQACGRVLIASDIAAAREVVQHGVTGLLFAKGDSAALADSILRAAADPDLHTAIGTQARAAAERYTFETALDEYERVFTAL